MGTMLKSNINIIKYISWGLVIMLLITDESLAAHRLCGPILTETLTLMCKNGFNPMLQKTKKSINAFDYTENDIGNDIIPLSYSSFFLDKLYENNDNLMAKTRRRRHGIVEECCTNSCTMPELLSYCN